MSAGIYFGNLTCAHCGKKEDFSNKHGLYHDIVAHAGQTEHHVRLSGFFQCRSCNGVMHMFFRLHRPVHHYPFLDNLIIHRSMSPVKRPAGIVTMDYLGFSLNEFSVIEQMSFPGQQNVPQHIPLQLKQLFTEEVLHSHSSSRHRLISCRAILEFVCKNKLKKSDGNLADFIDELFLTGLLSEDMTSWAHKIRKMANEAIHHQVEPSDCTVNEAISFTRILLELLYTYPETVKQLVKKYNNEKSREP